jgi:hypothetical protein
MSTISLNIENEKKKYIFDVNESNIKSIINFISSLSESQPIIMDELETSINEVQNIRKGTAQRKSLKQMLNEK